MESIIRRIRREGPIPFSAFLEDALYDPDDGFFARGRGAGRGGRDFVTSPETGSSFGAVVARALDAWWDDLGRPDPFLVVETGAGRGRLAREVLRAEPACRPALHYLLVERSRALREAQRKLLHLEPVDEVLGPFAATAGHDELRPVPGVGPLLAQLETLPAHEVEGVVLANELLDNLPVDVAEWTGDAWAEVRVALGPEGFSEVLVPLSEHAAAGLGADTAGLELPPGTRLPVPVGLEAWLSEVGAVLRRGRLVVFDYVVPARVAVTRSPRWMRTYREHAPGGDALDAPGSQDVTADVVTESLARLGRAAGLEVVDDVDQGTWLRALGLDDLVAAGDRIWAERAHLGDLEAVAGRSRGVEAAALTDPAGLGAHRVVTLVPAAG